MDVKKTENRKPLVNRWWLLMAIAAMIFIYLITSSFVKHESVARDAIIVGAIKKGDMEVSVQGYGELRSSVERLVNVDYSATISEIILKPGAIVEPDSVLVKLSNPDLELEFLEVQQEYNLRESNLRQLKLQNERDLLQETDSLEDVRATYEVLKFKYSAQKTLVEKGIIPKVTFLETELNLYQYKEKMEFQKRKIEALKNIQFEAQKIATENLGFQLKVQQTIRDRIDKLTVRAGMRGVLQSLSVELGQSIQAGQKIALIGSLKELDAIIRVPQSRAHEIKNGQPVRVSIYGSVVVGEVARISPTVAENTVSVDVRFNNELPDGAKPYTSVNAEIVIESLKNTSYLERPANSKKMSKGKIFKISNDQDVAELVSIEYGKESGRYIQVLSPVNVGDQYVVSDLSNLDSNFISIK